MRTSPRTKSSTLWDNSPANTSLSVPDHPLTGGICLSPSFSQTKFLQPLEQSVRPQTFYGPKTSTHWRKTPTDGPPSIQIPPPTGGFFRVSWGGARQQTNDRQHATGPPQRHAQEHPTETNKKRLPGRCARREPQGNTKRTFRESPRGLDRKVLQTVECGGALLSHTLSSAVPSPQPGLSFRVRKGTGRLTWAMTTAKPL